MAGASTFALVGRIVVASPIIWEVALGAGEMVLEGVGVTSATFWIIAGVVVGVVALSVLIWLALDDE